MHGLKLDSVDDQVDFRTAVACCFRQGTSAILHSSDIRNCDANQRIGLADGKTIKVPQPSRTIKQDIVILFSELPQQFRCFKYRKIRQLSGSRQKEQGWKVRYR